jgi:hypothetical protein
VTVNTPTEISKQYLERTLGDTQATIERAADCDEKPNDWCRMLVLENGKEPIGIMPTSKLSFDSLP